jgi:hypothetical protein
MLTEKNTVICSLRARCARNAESKENFHQTAHFRISHISDRKWFRTYASKELTTSAQGKHIHMTDIVQK